MGLGEGKVNILFPCCVFLLDIYWLCACVVFLLTGFLKTARAEWRGGAELYADVLPSFWFFPPQKVVGKLISRERGGKWAT